MIHPITIELEDIVFNNISYDVTVEVEGHTSENNGDSKQLYPEIDSIVVTRVQSINEDGLFGNEIMVEHRSDIDTDLYVALLYIVSNDFSICETLLEHIAEYDRDMQEYSDEGN
jgi:hypothetical protein